MCLKHKYIYTNAHHLQKNGYAQYKTPIPCNDCPECFKEISNEWQLRTYYEYLQCIKDKGFIIWDCLTYDENQIPRFGTINKHIPEKYDFTCFNWNEIQNFIARLRDKIGYKNMRYIIAGEYGGEDEYYKNGKIKKATGRPHYHMLLFYTGKLTEIEVSKKIKETWKKGITYGIDDKGSIEFWNNGVINTLEKAIQKANYIANYCVKNPKYDKTAQKKIRKTLEFFYKIETGNEKIDKNQLTTPEWRKRKKQLLDNVKCRHLQSKGYGKYLIEYNETNKRIYEDIVWMPNNSPDKPKFWTKLPKYYKRKIYYDHYRENGVVKWKLNEVGINYKLNNINKTIELYAKRLEKIETYSQNIEFRNIINQYNKEHKIDTKEDRWATLNDLLYAYKNNRDWKEIAKYYLYYKDRIAIDKKEIKEIIKLNATPTNLWTANIYYNYCHRTDIDNLGHQMIGLEDLGDKYRGYQPPTGNEKRPKQFNEKFTINENWSTEWNDLDKLWDILERIDVYKEWNETKKYELALRQKELYKKYNKQTQFK